MPNGYSIFTSYANPCPEVILMPEQEPLVLDDYRDIHTLNLDQFPHAESLSIQFEDETPILMADGLGLRLALPWWDRSDLERRARGGRGAPFGDPDDPFEEEEQGWRLVIWRSGEMIYVLAGDEAVFRVWFSVTFEQYLSAWAALS
jgi:hypothetical protein